MFFMIFLHSGPLKSNTFTVSNTNDSGTGSLRNTIQAASSDDTIVFSAGLSNDSIILTSGQIIITKNLVLLGPGAKLLAISGGKNSRIFEINTGISLIIKDITLRLGFSGTSNGGAVLNHGYLSLYRCYVAHHHSSANGGAIFTKNFLYVEDCTFAYNKADSNGGAIANELGRVEIYNSTLSNNYAGGHGGAFFQRSVNSYIPYTFVYSSTIVENYAVLTGGGFTSTFVDYRDTAKLEFASSIIAKNTSSISYGHDIARGLSSRCYMLSKGNNLVGNSDSSGFQAVTGDILGNSKGVLDPKTGPLKDNGGPTPTHALGCGSPALDFGDPFHLLSYDQRGYNRKHGGVADIGSFETQTDMYVPQVDIGKDIDTCLKTHIVLNAGRPQDSVNWLKMNGLSYLQNSKVLNFLSSWKDSIIAEVISPAGCAGYDTIIIGFKDVNLPKFTSCPSDIKVFSKGNSCEIPVSWTLPTATDNCGLDTIIASHQPGDTFQTGMTTVTYQAIDFAKNKAICSFKITVSDTVKPVINKITDINGITEPGKCGSVVTYIPPKGTDNCPGANTVKIKGLGPGSFFPAGTTEETYVVSDVSGNTDTSRFFVKITDWENPDIEPPANISVSTDSGSCAAVVNYTFPVATDNCPNPKLIMLSGFSSGSAFPKGTTVVAYRLEDNNGNFDTCSFTVTVNDNEKPRITCPQDVESCDTFVVYPLPQFSDNCPGSTLQLISGIGSGKAFPYGTTTEVYEVTDLAGNKNTCSFNVLVSPAPKIEAGNDTFVYYGESIVLSPQADDKNLIFKWSPDSFINDVTSSGPVVNPENTIRYHVQVTNQYGCTAEDSILVEVKNEIFIPTVFTPGNADSKNTNDTWNIKGLKKLSDWEVHVFTLWGQEVFFSKGYETPWNGEYKGKEVPAGTYLYVVDNPNDNLKAFKGDLTIIR